jgi:hypothetical protein
MTKVDPSDDSIVRYVIRRHRFDAATNHFRWIDESAYDSKDEFDKSLDEAASELESRRIVGRAHEKEQVAGQKLPANYYAESLVRRKRRIAQGAFRPDTLRNRVVIAFTSKRYLFFRRRPRH